MIIELFCFTFLADRSKSIDSNCSHSLFSYVTAYLFFSHFYALHTSVPLFLLFLFFSTFRIWVNLVQIFNKFNSTILNSRHWGSFRPFGIAFSMILCIFIWEKADKRCSWQTISIEGSRNEVFVGYLVLLLVENRLKIWFNFNYCKPLSLM